MRSGSGDARRTRRASLFSCGLGFGSALYEEVCVCVCCWSLSDKKREKEKREKMSDTPCDDLRKGKSAVIPPSVKSQAPEVLDARCCSLRVRPLCVWCLQFLILFSYLPGWSSQAINSIVSPSPSAGPPPPPDRPKFRSFFSSSRCSLRASSR